MFCTHPRTPLLAGALLRDLLPGEHGGRRDAAIGGLSLGPQLPPDQRHVARRGDAASPLAPGDHSAAAAPTAANPCIFHWR